MKPPKYWFDGRRPPVHARALARIYGYATVEEMRRNCQFVRITGAGLKESHVHDVQITRESPNYRLG